MDRRWRLQAFVLGLGLTVAAAAQPSSSYTEQLRKRGYIVARVTGDFPTADVVTFITDNAQHWTVPRSLRALGARVAVRELVMRRCGSVQPGYSDRLEAMNRANGAAITLDSPLGSPAPEIRLPACLFASRSEDLTRVKVGPEESQTVISQRLTGVGRFVPSHLRALFGRVRPLAEKETINAAYVTAPTPIKPIIPLADFIALAPKSVTIDQVRAAGRILGPVDAPCVSSRSDYPFDSAAVAQAFLRGKLGNPVQIRVGVVDNGFWGVECDWPGNCPKRRDDGTMVFSAPFDEALFESEPFRESGGFIGPVKSNIFPVNYFNADVRQAPPITDPVKGHGTHVAGILIGGAALSDADRSILKLDNDRWLKLSIYNLAPGALEFPAHANDNFTLLMGSMESPPKILNMSVAFYEGKGADVIRLVDSADWQKTLVIAAAGNEPSSLTSNISYPAVLGNRDNVLSVASVDASGKLSSFSSWDSEVVGAAAPGCNIKSWLSLGGTAQPVSGTSQAAAVASFGAALLNSIWPSATPYKLKSRLAYSGDLLPAGDRDKVHLGTSINLFQALLFRFDVIRFKEPDPLYPNDDQRARTRVVIGDLAGVPGFSCVTPALPISSLRQVQAFTSTGPGTGRAIIRAGDSLRTCEARLDAQRSNGLPNTAAISAADEFAGGRFTGTAPTVAPIPVQDIISFVRREP